MRRRWATVGCVLVIALFLSSVVATAATSLFGTRFRAGETIQFEIEDSTTWLWGGACCCCCSCTTTTIFGWRITDTAGQTVYSVVHDAPVSSTMWTGSWGQTNVGGTAVPSGQYTLYVDTSVGTLSRCITIYDPCACCNPCYSCGCNQVTSIADCGCKATLVFVDTCAGCFPFFGLFGCGCYSSPCGSGCCP